MLSHIIIRNFAIIDSLDLAFHEGFTALTGETGAGKSIIIDAIGLLLGGRASAEMIRAGEPAATVEGVFELSTAERARLTPALEAAGLEPDDQLVIKRVVSTAGRNKVFVNGGAARASILQDVTAGLVDIVSQHESYSLLDPESHVGVLDGFGGLAEEAAGVAAQVAQLRSLQREVARLKANARRRNERIADLTRKIDELDGADLQPGEDDAIDRELEKLHHAEKLQEVVQNLFHMLYEDDNAVLDLLGAATGQLSRVSFLDPTLESIVEVLESCKLEVSEAATDLRTFGEEIDRHPDRLNELEERRALIERLKSMYGETIEEVTARRGELQTELDELCMLDFRVGEAAQEAEALEVVVMGTARALSERRAAAAAQLEALAEAELKQLGMARCRFKVQFLFYDADGAEVGLDAAASESLSERGLDHVEFLISPNPGEGFKPMVKIASGGELSRITLALKGALMLTDPVSTYVFDEVDTGIGGWVAEVVGQKLRNIAVGRQVLCITHLAQVASCAHQHLKVEKHVSGDRTVSGLRLLSEDERVGEVARMIGGADLTRKTMAHAEEMLGRSRT